MSSAVPIKELVFKFRENFAKKGKSTEIFDEVDPGNGDKDVIRSLNKQLAIDSDIELPKGYMRQELQDLEV